MIFKLIIPFFMFSLIGVSFAQENKSLSNSDTIPFNETIIFSVPSEETNFTITQVLSANNTSQQLAKDPPTIKQIKLFDKFGDEVLGKIPATRLPVSFIVDSTVPSGALYVYGDCTVKKNGNVLGTFFCFSNVSYKAYAAGPGTYEISTKQRACYQDSELCYDASDFVYKSKSFTVGPPKSE